MTTLGGQSYKLMKPVVQIKYELLRCTGRIVVYVWMWQREEGYEISLGVCSERSVKWQG